MPDDALAAVATLNNVLPFIHPLTEAEQDDAAAGRLVAFLERELEILPRRHRYAASYRSQLARMLGAYPHAARAPRRDVQ